MTTTVGALVRKDWLKHAAFSPTASMVQTALAGKVIHPLYPPPHRNFLGISTAIEGLWLPLNLPHSGCRTKILLGGTCNALYPTRTYLQQKVTVRWEMPVMVSGR